MAETATVAALPNTETPKGVIVRIREAPAKENPKIDWTAEFDKLKGLAVVLGKEKNIFLSRMRDMPDEAAFLKERADYMQKHVILRYLVQNDKVDTMVKDILTQEGHALAKGYTESNQAYMDRYNGLRSELFAAIKPYAEKTVAEAAAKYQGGLAAQSRSSSVKAL